MLSQAASFSLSPRISPRISRWPSPVIPHPDHQGIDQDHRIGAFQPTVLPGVDPGIQTRGQGSHRGLGNRVPHSSSVMEATFRVETPCTTLSIMARTRACSDRW
jgi:hypothetical protein